MGPIAATVNALGGDFRWQHLPVPFEVYADGIDLVIFEEFGSGAAALHLADQVERNALLADEDYRRWFRRDYDARFGMRVWHRDFFDAEIVDCPDDSVVGKTFGQVGVDRGGRDAAPPGRRLPRPRGRARHQAAVAHHHLQPPPRVPGEARAAARACRSASPTPGAHLRNMAFYNYGLRFLRRVRDAERAGKPFLSLEQAVHRLTGELADWYSLDAGHLRVGDRADLVVVDPEHLDDVPRRLRRGAGGGVREPVADGQPQRRRRAAGHGRRHSGVGRRAARAGSGPRADRPVPPRHLTRPAALPAGFWSLPAGGPGCGHSPAAQRATFPAGIDQNPAMTTLLTGASGFLGAHTVAALLERGERVRAFVRTPSKLASALTPLGLSVDDDRIEVVAGADDRRRRRAERGRGVRRAWCTRRRRTPSGAATGPR